MKKSSKQIELIDLSAVSKDTFVNGGFSGLVFEKQIGDELIFLSHSDRGPNGEEIETHNKNVSKRPFLKADFQPFWIRFSVNRKTKAAKLIELIHLTLPDGKPLNGLPNVDGHEIPVTIAGKELTIDINGIDPESLCFDGNHFWMGEEYGPSILKFTASGKLLKRYVPEGTYADGDKSLFNAILPQDMLRRKNNRGFEGIACKDGKIFAILQSPLKDEKKVVRIFEFDPKSETVTKEYFYPLESKKADKIGDLTFMNDSLLVLEQNGETGDDGIHKIFKVNLDKVDSDGHLKKTLVVDLVEAGYSFSEKVEGLAMINDTEIAVVNDNDFAVNDSSLKTIMGFFKIGDE